MTDTKENIRFVLFTEIGSGHNLVGERHALSVAQHTANQTLAENLVSFDLLHLKLHHAVVDSDNISRLQILVQRFVVHTDMCFVTFHFVCGKSKIASVSDHNLTG